MAKNIKLDGKTLYRDTISGFEGLATARVEFLYGCVRITLEGVDSKGDPTELAFDEQRLVEAKSNKPPKPTATSGGPRPNIPRSGLRS